MSVGPRVRNFPATSATVTAWNNSSIHNFYDCRGVSAKVGHLPLQFQYKVCKHPQRHKLPPFAKPLLRYAQLGTQLITCPVLHQRYSCPSPVSTWYCLDGSATICTSTSASTANRTGLGGHSVSAQTQAIASECSGDTSQIHHYF